jgi:hypothetical protein
MMPVQSICSPARRTPPVRHSGRSEVRTLLSELIELRDALADIAGRLEHVEVHPVEPDPHTQPLVLCKHLNPTPAVKGSRHWPLRNLRHVAGWSQASMVARMRAVANHQGLRLPAAATLKTMVSRWENGAPVGEFYDAIFTILFLSYDQDADQAVAS